MRAGSSAAALLPLALALTLSLVAPAQAAWAPLPAPADVFPEGSEERATVAQVLGDGPPTDMQDLVTYSCGGTAPLTTACAQEVVVPGGSNVVLSLKEGTGFTGTIVGTLTDRMGNFRTVTCTYLLFLADVTAPSCSKSGNGQPMVGGAMQLTGQVADASVEGTGAPALGYWEVFVDVSTA